MRRERKELSIRKTANLTAKMRAERGEETFETTTTTKTTSTTMSMETTSTTKSEKSDSSSKSHKKKLDENRMIRLQKEKVLPCDVDLDSLCEFSCDTRSLNSISEVEPEFEKKCEESKCDRKKVIPIQYVTMFGETPIQAQYVTDFDLCSYMCQPKNFSAQAKRIQHFRRFEVESKFIEEVVADVDKLLVASTRMDVEVKVVKTRDINGMPRCEIRMIRRMKAEKAGAGLLRQPGLYGFEAGDVEVKDKAVPSLQISKKPTNFQFMSGIVKSVKRRVGL